MARLALGKHMILIPHLFKQNLDNVSKYPYNRVVNEGFLRGSFLFFKVRYLLTE